MSQSARSGFVVGAKVVQLVFGLLWFSLVAFLLWLSRSPEIPQQPDAHAAAWGLEIAAGVFAPIALLVLLGAYGMMRNQLWGWWVALLADLGTVLLLAYSMIDDGWGNIDAALVGTTAASVVPVVFLLLPGVRQFYWAKTAASAEHSVS